MSTCLYENGTSHEPLVAFKVTIILLIGGIVTSYLISCIFDVVIVSPHLYSPTNLVDDVSIVFPSTMRGTPVSIIVLTSNFVETEEAHVLDLVFVCEKVKQTVLGKFESFAAYAVANTIAT